MLALGADLLTVVGHKLSAPKGIGALHVRRGIRLRQLRDRPVHRLATLLPGPAHLNGHPTESLPNTANIRIDGVPALGLLADLTDVVISAGSACHSGRDEPPVCSPPGWLRVPLSLVGPVVREQLLTSRGSPALDQLALATLMKSGRYDRHLLRMREVYRQRREALARAVTKHAPGLRLVGLGAGCHAVLELPAGVTEAEVVQSALRRALRVCGLSRQRVDPPRAAEADVPAALVLGFGNLNEERILRGVEVLGKTMSDKLA